MPNDGVCASTAVQERRGCTNILGCVDAHLALKTFFQERGKCFQNTVQAFPPVWEAFESLDEVWLRELSDLTHVSGSDLICGVLYYSAHSRVRAAVELGFSRCLPDAWSSLRAGVESVAFASCIRQDSVLARRLVAARPDARFKTFRRTFNDIREKSLRHASKYGLKELRRYWNRYSDSGSHVTVGSLASRVTGSVSGSTRSVAFNYLEVKKDVLLGALTDILMCSCVMEQVLFRDFKPRLRLDPQLEVLRAGLRDRREAAVKFLHSEVPRVAPTSFFEVGISVKV